MSERSHTVDARWREADAQSWEARSSAMEDWLDHTEDLVDMLEDDDTLVTALRSTAGLVRTKKNDVLREADKLRSQIADRSK